VNPTIRSNFAYLQQDDEQLARLGLLAERYFPADPNTCLLKLRQLAELLARLLAARAGLVSSAEDSQYDLLRRLQDYEVMPREVAQMFGEVQRLGNSASHAVAGDHRSALNALKLTWQMGLWFHRTFSNPSYKSGPFVPPTPPIEESAELRSELEQLRENLRQYEESHQSTSQRLVEIEARLKESKDEQTFWEQMATEADQAKAVLEERLKELQIQAVAQPKTSLSRVANASAKAASAIQLDETATRELIDAQLRLAGWEVDSPNLRHASGVRPEKGRNLAIAEWPTGSGPADYVLFVGLTPLAVVEAKRRNVDVSGAIQQAKRYSRDIVASQFEHPGVPWGENRIPFAFSTNGRPYLRQVATRSGIWFCDLRRPENLSHALDGWYTPEGLTALFKRDEDRAHRQLAEEAFDYGFPLRYYQKDAIRSIEAGIAGGRREMLLAMATGTGKTKTCIALIYRLLKAQRFRRILFLVDRSALGEQAANAFTDTRMENLQTFADTFGIKDLEEASPESDTAVHIATVQGMVQRLLYVKEDCVPPPVDRYDCIVVDECHRGYLLDRELSDSELTFRN
jgi:type I restriction enzyme R subunit